MLESNTKRRRKVIQLYYQTDQTDIILYLKGIN